MRISAIQPKIQANHTLHQKVSVLKEEAPKQTSSVDTISFKGGDDELLGLDGGLIAGFLIFAGELAVPAMSGCLGVLESVTAGAVAGSKIEDKISGINDNTAKH